MSGGLFLSGDQSVLPDISSPSYGTTIQRSGTGVPDRAWAGEAAVRSLMTRSCKTGLSLHKGVGYGSGYAATRILPNLPIPQGLQPRGKAPMSGFPLSCSRSGSGHSGGTGTPASIAGLPFRSR